MDPLRYEEYAALRATIRERGTARIWLAWAGIVGWATLVSAAASVGVRPIVSLMPLLVLVTTFEGVYALHTGVERIGRYLQVIFEEDADQVDASLRWETAAMRFGRLFPTRGSDPLFTWIFIAAIVLNLIPVVTARGLRLDALTILGVLHLAVIIRILRARRSAVGQRARDLDRFHTLVQEAAAGQPPRAAIAESPHSR